MTLSCESLDCVDDPVDHTADLAPARRRQLDIGGQAGRTERPQARQAAQEQRIDRSRRGEGEANGGGILGESHRQIEDVARPEASGPVTNLFRKDLGDGFEADRSAVDVEALLRRLARHRTGQNKIDIAFGQDELQGIRRFLVFAGQARSRLVQSRRQKPVACASSIK